jgi:excisionase family DNA binding protein
MHAPWLTIHELALALKVSVKTVRRAYLRGEIPVQRIFRFVRFDIEQVKEAMRRNGETYIEVGPENGESRRAPGGASRRREAAPSPRTVKRGRKFQPRPRRSV